MLALDGVHWIPTKVHLESQNLGSYLSLTIGPTEAGMSGSPILNDRGRAIGVVVIGNESVSADDECEDEESGPQPLLTATLPGWLLA